MAMNYNDTVFLPKTDFPMRANLSKREPDMLAAWTQDRLYERMIEKNEGRPLFILHDGPPFSNGDIHIGTAMNKILKDFIVRYKNMSGFQAPYVPGWDNHGLPIENKVAASLKGGRAQMSVPAFRDACRTYAEEYVDRQRAQFIRLGVLGRWENPYLTMDPHFEAREVEVFGSMYKSGYIYRGLKPVYWCSHDETALAEAEIEYQDVPCDSIYVGFTVCDDRPLVPGIDNSSIQVVIWTTTTWTLPGNVAISVHPRFSYGLYEENGKFYLCAEERYADLAAVCGWTPKEPVHRFTGRELDRVRTRHPFLPRESLVIVGEHVTQDSGTGCVHTAPGHGLEDFFACKPYDLPIVVPVDARGRMTEEAGPFVGLTTDEANVAILQNLKDSGALVATQCISHTYPHCWRCRKPVIYRATKQWFASVDSMKEDALGAVDNVSWLPAWGRERMASMVRERSDWCISRQRQWGLPIPAFFCESCDEPVVTDETIASVAAHFDQEGSNAWFARTPEELLPAGFACPHCGGKTFRKETDTLDGWFDSGSTHIAVLKTRDDQHWPADLYLEGGDQYRGWFQSSLLTAIAVEKTAPYKKVITHGWTVDGEGKKMSKSIGNVILPQEIIDKYGADLLRLWVASGDYHCDARISMALMGQLSESYMKIRNTARFILANLSDFDPNTLTPEEDLSELDRFALHTLGGLTRKVIGFYEAYEYHTLLSALHNYCVTDLSGFYLDILKDRLYCDARDSQSRRAAQTVIYRILDTLTRLMAPILAFTSDEIWKAMPHPEGIDGSAVMVNDMPALDTLFTLPANESVQWERLLLMRDRVNLALEQARAEKRIGKSLEARVVLTAEGEDLSSLREKEALLPALFIVSSVAIAEGPEAVQVEAAPGEKCPRCWTYTETHPNAEHPELCPRCTDVVAAL